MSIAPNRLSAGAAAAGIVAPFAFLIGLAVTSRVESDFMEAKHWTPWPVGLGLGPEGWLWEATCVALGVPLLVFGIAVVRGNVSRVGGTAFAMAGIGGLLIAPSIDIAQIVGSLLFLLGFVVGSVALWRSIRKAPDWPGTRRWMAVGLAVLAPVLVLPPDRLTVLNADPFPGYLMNAVLLAPLAVMATRLLVIATRSMESSNSKPVGRHAM